VAFGRISIGTGEFAVRDERSSVLRDPLKRMTAGTQACARSTLLRTGPGLLRPQQREECSHITMAEEDKGPSLLDDIEPSLQTDPEGYLTVLTERIRRLNN
jgi:hypothetical protein